MAYQRKTEDEYWLTYNYGYGDGRDILCVCTTYKEAKEDQEAYIENEHICPTIEKHRVPKGYYPERREK